MPTAHCVSTLDGFILEADSAFLELIGRQHHEIAGLSYKEITHPDDLDRSGAMLASLIKRAAPVRLQKRYIRPDGSAVTANLYVTRFADPDRLVSTLFWNEVGRDLPPARLWEMALRVRRLRQVRREEFGVHEAISPLGDILNSVYLAEAEGRVVGLAEIARESELSPAIVSRWLKHLGDQGIFETGPNRDANVQFTHLGMSKMERMLASAFDVPESD
ncbi:PAS domain-containing protein [Sphingomonas sp. Leaf21]|uniref:PAS domain-containing protein n=1 Tax=Sphingomonas sp. Leaf21 TaxID=2876550 RepID=UPI001E2E309F|nr:PAS domain-containing protein [Sphingomonas sp. Leaf21]